jgi:hypothetical protein
VSSVPARSWQAEVLEQLDSAQEQHLLIGPGNANYPSAALRMDAFTSDAEWLLTLQLVAFARREARFVRDLQVFGNHVPGPSSYTSVDLIHPRPGERLFVDSEFQLDVKEFSIIIGMTHRDFHFSEEDFEAAGIGLHQMAPELALLRILAARERDSLLLSPAQIPEHLGKAGLEHLFGLDEWRHPDEAEDELPSQTRCFTAIAESIERRARGDLSSCTDNCNTHWLDWVRFELRQ